MTTLRPKWQTGNLVARQGLSVPRRFATLHPLKSHLRHRHPTDDYAIVVRSDHACENTNQLPSGFFDSVVLPGEMLYRRPDKGIIASTIPSRRTLQIIHRELHANSHRLPEAKFCREIAELYRSNLRVIPKFANQPAGVIDRFLAQFRVSYWEYIPGINLTIAADPARFDTTHIFATHTESTRFGPRALSLYATVRNSVVAQYQSQIPEAIFQPSDLPSISAYYYMLQKLPCFGASHCPIIEAQRGIDGALHFLQYTQYRDIEPHPTHTVASSSEGILAVRGATPPTGMPCRLTFNVWPEVSTGNTVILGPNSVNNGVAIPVGLVITSEDRLAYDLVNGGHDDRQAMLKPDISLAIDKSHPLIQLFRNHRLQRRTLQEIRFTLLADGQHARISDIVAIDAST